MDRFEEYLLRYTNLGQSSINLYIRTVRSYIRQFDDITIDNLNRFVSDSFRESRSYYVKYVFRHYLKYAEKEHLYDKIIRVKTKPRKQIRHYLPYDDILRIINNIGNDKYKDMCRIQYATGARIHEVITFKEENIDIGDKYIRIILEGKGKKERTTYLSHEYKPLIDKYMKGKPGYLFLHERYYLADEKEMIIAVNTMRQYIYDKLKESAHELGLSRFGTHDFRANAAETIRQRNKDPYIVQKILGHKDIRTTLKYFNETPDSVRRTILQHQRQDHDPDNAQE